MDRSSPPEHVQALERGHTRSAALWLVLAVAASSLLSLLLALRLCTESSCVG